jgi:hypothetical protein
MRQLDYWEQVNFCPTISTWGLLVLRPALTLDSPLRVKCKLGAGLKPGTRDGVCERSERSALGMYLVRRSDLEPITRHVRTRWTLKTQESSLFLDVPQTIPKALFVLFLDTALKMKLVIASATGFVGKELLKQAMGCSEFTSIVTLGRRAVVEDYDKARLTDIVIDNFEHYPDSVMEQLADADACIWYGAEYSMLSSLLMEDKDNCSHPHEIAVNSVRRDQKGYSRLHIGGHKSLIGFKQDGETSPIHLLQRRSRRSRLKGIYVHA